MSAQYALARSAGWIAPLAIVIAGYRCRSGLADAVRSINPAGAAVIFGAGYLAALGSPLFALAVIAFLAGLYLSTRVVTVETQAQPTTITATVDRQQAAAAVPALPPGLQIQSVTLKAQSARRTKSAEADYINRANNQ